MGKVVLAIKILDFDLEGSHFIIEADISLRQKADDNMESHWPRYFFEKWLSLLVSQGQDLKIGQLS